MPTIPKHWNYFLAVEKELLECTRYVEFSESNFHCYSNEFAKIIVLAASEVDSIWQELCSKFEGVSKQRKITDCYVVLKKRFPKIDQCQLSIEKYQLTLQPWKDWTSESRPDWWAKSYNKLKHERAEHFTSATLEAALNAVAAQFLALQLFHLTQFDETVSVPFSSVSSLFSNKRNSENKGGVFWGYGGPFDHLDTTRFLGEITAPRTSNAT